MTKLEIRQENKNQLLYNLIIALDIPPEDMDKYKIDEKDFAIYKRVQSLKQRLNKQDPLEDNATVVGCKLVEPEAFGRVISFLRKYDERYEKNLSEKEDYHHYECYMSNGGLAGFCIEKETQEKCNIYSVAKGLGNKLVDYAMINYECLGLENCMAETYHNYYKGRYDMIPHHWEENWDFPGDKSKAIFYGWILPKGVLDSGEKAEMMLLAEMSQENAYTEAQVMTCYNKEMFCVLSEEQKQTKNNARAIIFNMVKQNKIYRNSLKKEYA